MQTSSSSPSSPSSSSLSPWERIEKAIGFDGDKNKFTAILPVLFYEYLALSLTKSIIPGMIITAFGDYSYFIVGVLETLKGFVC